MYINESQWSEATILMETVAKDTVDPQRPECGSLVEPTATDVAEPTLHPAGSTQMWDCYRNEIVEPQRPDSGRHVRIQADCRGRSGTMVINESGEGKDNTIYQQKHA